jgi:phospholipid-binding lipoprotein MlaA
MNFIRAFIVAAAIALTGCASTHASNPADPLEPLNRGVYQFNEGLDKAVIKPVAQGYSAVIPPPIKMMVSNFFSNLDDVIVTANDLLQLKLIQFLSDGTRFVVNSTIGFYGTVDVGSMVGLEKHNEDFGQTLGKWGVGNGPYLVLPILGPSTVRDGIGLYVDSRPSKVRRIEDMRTRNQVYAVKGISNRSQLLDEEKVLEDAIIDRYEFVRDAYLLRRKSLVYDGNPPRDQYDDEQDNFDYKEAPNPSAPSSEQDIAPVIQPVSDATLPASDAAQPPATTTSQTVTDLPSIHKVWVAQGTGIN